MHPIIQLFFLLPVTHALRYIYDLFNSSSEREICYLIAFVIYVLEGMVGFMFGKH